MRGITGHGPSKYNSARHCPPARDRDPNARFHWLIFDVRAALRSHNSQHPRTSEPFTTLSFACEMLLHHYPLRLCIDAIASHEQSLHFTYIRRRAQPSPYLFSLFLPLCSFMATPKSFFTHSNNSNFASSINLSTLSRYNSQMHAATTITHDVSINFVPSFLQIAYISCLFFPLPCHMAPLLCLCPSPTSMAYSYCVSLPPLCTVSTYCVSPPPLYMSSPYCVSPPPPRMEPPS